MGTVREGRSVFPLRPLGVSEILDAAVTTLRTYPKPSIGAAAVVYGAFTLVIAMCAAGIGLLVLAADDPVLQAVALVLSSLGTTALSAVSNVGQFVVTAGFASIVSGLVARAVLGRPATLRRLWAETSRSFGWLVLYALITAVASAPFAVAAAALTTVLGLGRPGPYLFVAGMLVLGTAGLFVAAQFWLAPAAIVLERVNVIKGLGRSWQLNAGGRWRATGLLALTVLLCLLLWTAGTSGLFSIVGLLYSIVGTLTASGSVVVIALATTVGGGLLVGTACTPFLSAVPGVAYVDRRMRVEGFDLVLGQLRAAGRLTAVPEDAYLLGPATPFAAPDDRRPPERPPRAPRRRPPYPPPPRGVVPPAVPAPPRVGTGV